jgi:hypothetical protein
VLWAAWEHAKPGLHEGVAGYDEHLAPAPARPAPPADPPKDLDVPATAEAAPPLPEMRDKVKLVVAVPERVFREVQQLALFADRSMSWMMQAAYLRSRDRLLGARRSQR